MASASTPSSATSPTRTSSSDHGAPPSSVARSISTKNVPNPSAASPASASDARIAGPGAASAGSRAASTMPAIATTMPATWIAPGRSPVASPTSTGTAAPVAETGATMLIVPIASPR